MPRKLNREQVMEARNSYAEDPLMTYGILAGKLGVSVPCIRMAIRGQTYQDMPGKITAGDQRRGKRRGGGNDEQADIRDHRDWEQKRKLAEMLCHVKGEDVVILSYKRGLDVRIARRYDSRSKWKLEELVKAAKGIG